MCCICYNDAGDEMKKIRFIVSSDIHGVIYDHRYGDNSKHPMGLARLSSYLKKARESDDVLYIDNGDALQGTPLLTYINKENKKPHALSEVFARCKINYYNLGNHDFNYGKDVLFNFMQSMHAPCITTNVLYQNKPIGKSVIQTISNITFGIIGVVTDYIPHWEQPSHIEGFTFLDVVDTVKKEIEHLKNQVDTIIVVYHGGFERDLLTDKPTERLTGENVGSQLAKLDDIEVLFTGHQHRSINTTTNNTLVLQCANNATQVMQVTIDPQTKQKQGELISLEHVTMDEKVVQKLATLEEKTQRWLDQPIGYVNQSLRIDDQKQARLHKHPLVSFINQVQLDVSNAQLSVTSLFNDAIGLDEKISMRDLVSTYMYPNTLVVKELSGKQVKEMLEHSAQYFILNDEGDIDINPTYVTPKPQHFNYDMMDGVEYTIKVSNPVGEKIVSLTYQGTPVQDDEPFLVAMNNYRAVGGGDYGMVAQAPTVIDTGKDMVDILMEYITKHSPIQVKHTNNIKVLR